MPKRKSVPYTLFSRKLLEQEGYTVEDVERKNCWSGKKNDFFGFGDLLAVKVGKPPLIIQSTSGPNHMARVRKILGQKVGKENYAYVGKKAQLCLKVGFRIVVISWKKAGRKWDSRLQEIKLRDFSS